jgi:hypothetical protein
VKEINLFNKLSIYVVTGTLPYLKLYEPELGTQRHMLIALVDISFSSVGRAVSYNASWKSKINKTSSEVLDSAPPM